MKKIMSNFGLKLASLVFAGVIWLSVTNNQDPQISRQIRDVQVRIVDNSNYLKNNNLGRATFFPINIIKPNI